MQKHMLELVLVELERNKGDWGRVSKRSGVPYHTLTKIAQRKFGNPGVLHIQRLADCFGIVVLSPEDARRLSPQPALPL